MQIQYGYFQGWVKVHMNVCYLTLTIVLFLQRCVFIYRQYKPLYKELSVWPELNLSNPPGISPFAENKPGKLRQNPKTSSAHKDGHKEKCVASVYCFAYGLSLSKNVICYSLFKVILKYC